MRVLNIAILFLVLHSNFLFSASYSESYQERIKQVASFIKSKKPCRLAVMFGLETSYMTAKDPSIFCIQELTQSQGTVNEKKGCAAAYYSPSTDEYSIIRMAENKPCNRNVEIDLIQTRDDSALGMGFHVLGILCQFDTCVVVYSEHPSLSKEVDKIIAEQKALVKNETRRRDLAKIKRKLLSE